MNAISLGLFFKYAWVPINYNKPDDFKSSSKKAMNTLTVFDVDKTTANTNMMKLSCIHINQTIVYIPRLDKRDIFSCEINVQLCLDVRKSVTLVKEKKNEGENMLCYYVMLCYNRMPSLLKEIVRYLN